MALNPGIPRGFLGGAPSNLTKGRGMMAAPAAPNPFHPAAPLLQGMHQVAATPVAPNSATGTAHSGTQPGTGSVSGGDGPPLDSTYFAAIAANNAKLNSQVNALNLQQGSDQTNYQNTLGNLAYQQPRSQLSLMQAANHNGSLYSSVEGQNQGNLVTQYANQRTNATNSYNTAAAKIAAAIAQDRSDATQYQQDQAAASGARAVAASAKDPTLGNSAPGAHNASNSPGAQQLTSEQQNSLVAQSQNQAAAQRSAALAAALRSKARAPKAAPKALAKGTIISG